MQLIPAITGRRRVVAPVVMKSCFSCASRRVNPWLHEPFGLLLSSFGKSMKLSLRFDYVLAILLLLGGVVQAAEPAPFVEKRATATLLEQVRQGGFVLYMRHGPTDSSRSDRLPEIDLSDCATQRPLTENGRRVAAYVGEQIRRARLPLGDAYASPMCRTRETAEAAFRRVFIFDEGLLYTANLTDVQKRPKIALTRKLLSMPVASGTNRIIVAHGPNLVDVMDYFVQPEAALVIVRPLGENGFEYVATIAPDEWPALLSQ